MKIVLAQLKKDARAQGTPLILWIVCFVIGTVLIILQKVGQSKGADLGSHLEPQQIVGAVSLIAIYMMCLTAVGFGFTLLLPIVVIRVIHDDPLMGTTAFWRTRPIPRMNLMVAKILFIGITMLPMLFAFGGDAKAGDDKFWPALLGWMAAVSALAAITPGMGAWFGYGAAFLFGKLIFSGIIEALWSHYHGPSALFSADALRPLIETGEVFHLNGADFIHLCYFAGFSAVFVHQYLTLRTRRSLLLFIFILGAVGVLEMINGPKPGESHAVIQFNSGSNTLPTPTH